MGNKCQLFKPRILWYFIKQPWQSNMPGDALGCREQLLCPRQHPLGDGLRPTCSPPTVITRETTRGDNCPPGAQLNPPCESASLGQSCHPHFLRAPLPGQTALQTVLPQSVSQEPTHKSCKTITRSLQILVSIGSWFCEIYVDTNALERNCKIIGLNSRRTIPKATWTPSQV